MFKKLEIVEKYKNLHSLEKTPLLIEYEHSPESLDQDVANYRFHISFTNEKTAQDFFKIMGNHLPLSLKSNRVIVGTDEESGVIPAPSAWHFQCPFINFKDADTAEQFYFFIKERISWKDNTSITCFERHKPGGGKIENNNFFVYFRGLLQPDCSIEHRKKIFDDCLFAILLLNANLHSDLVFHIGLLYLQCKYTQPDLRQSITNTSQFRVPQEHFSQPFKKISCKIEYSFFSEHVIKDGIRYGSNQYNIHLICSDKQEAVILKKNMDKALTKFGGVLENNVVTIEPSFDDRPRVCFELNNRLIDFVLKFWDCYEAKTFDSFVNFNSTKVILENDCIRLPGWEPNNVKKINTNLAKNSIFAENGRQSTNLPQNLPNNNTASTENLSIGEILCWLCVPIIGWLYLLYRALNSCSSVDTERSIQNGISI
ncbi:MAG: hypothetical protein H0U70_13360 [Tatlockia sp.]|nr:hypothetical protein [Tatlockia sp.]